MTLPSLLTTINNKIKNHQVEVFTRKFSTGTDLLNIDNGIGPYYNSDTPSYEFAQALSKHLKIVTICHSGEDMKNCFPNEVHVGDDTVDITKITSGENLGLNKDDYTDVAGIVLGTGTPMLLSWNKNCPVSDPDVVATKGNSNQTSAPTYSCVKGFIDVNGFRGPNRISSNIKRLDDVIGFNGTSSLAESTSMPCLFELSNGKCLMAPPNAYKPATIEECKKMADDGYGNNKSKCATNEDYWAGAVRACGGVSKVMDASAFDQLAKEIYGVNLSCASEDWQNVSVNKDTLIAVLSNYGISALSNGYAYLFLQEEGPDVYNQPSAGMGPKTVYCEMTNRDDSGMQVLCVGDK